MQSVTIELPLPHKNLSPNARCHWRLKAKATKEARMASKLVTMNAMNRSCCAEWLWSEATVQAVFHFKDRRRHDRDNLLSSLKAHFDGLTDSKLIADDSGLTHLPVRIEIDKKNPRVVLQIIKGPHTMTLQEFR